MNKNEMVAILKKLELNRVGCEICMGSALLMYGLREDAHDVDIAVTEERFQEYLDKGYPIECNTWGRERILIDIEGFEIELFRETLMEVESEYFEGFYVQTLDSIIAWKEHLGREKDLRDLKMIKEYINKNR